MVMMVMVVMVVIEDGDGTMVVTIVMGRRW